MPEAQGGLGFGPVEAMVVMEELGRGIVVEPYMAVALVAVSLLKAGHAPSAALWLQGIAEGKERVVLAHQERAARYRLAHVEDDGAAGGGTWQLTGTKTVVPAGAHAGAFIVPARVGGAVDDPAGIALFLVSKGEPGVEVRGYPTQDGASAADLTLAGANAVELVAAGDAHAALERAIDIGIAALCAEGVGAMDKLVAITVEYMNTRKQFGVPIASFQALRHRIADVKMQLELARSMSFFATLKLGEAGAGAAPRAGAGQAAARHVDALRRPAVHPAARRHRRDRRIRRRPLLQAPDGDGDDVRRHDAPARRGVGPDAGHRRRVRLSGPRDPRPTPERMSLPRTRGAAGRR